MSFEELERKAVVKLTFHRDVDCAKDHGYFGCPARVDSIPGDYLWDVRIKTDQEVIPGGKELVTQIALLSPETAKTYFTIGTQFEFWESGIIGKGRIIDLLYN